MLSFECLARNFLGLVTAPCTMPPLLWPEYPKESELPRTGLSCLPRGHRSVALGPIKCLGDKTTTLRDYFSSNQKTTLRDYFSSNKKSNYVHKTLLTKRSTLKQLWSIRLKVSDGWISKINLFLSYTAVRSYSGTLGIKHCMSPNLLVTWEVSSNAGP